MKASAFQYKKARTVSEALNYLSEFGEDGRILAGGQSLLPALNMRLSDPQVLIDIQGISELKGISVTGDVIRIGALTTHTEIEESLIIQTHLPLLHSAVAHIAHRAVRNLGTFGGSLAYADPAAEWPACILVLDATLIIANNQGERRVKAHEFFIDLYTTSLQSDEILIACELQLPKAGSAFYFEELARRHGDYAVAGVAMSLYQVSGQIEDIKIAFFSVSSTAIKPINTEKFLKGKKINQDVIQEAIEIVCQEIETLPDLTSSAQMKNYLLGVLLERGLKEFQANKRV